MRPEEIGMTRGGIIAVLLSVAASIAASVIFPDYSVYASAAVVFGLVGAVATSPLFLLAFLASMLSEARAWRWLLIAVCAVAWVWMSYAALRSYLAS